MMQQSVLAMWMPSGLEWAVILVVALLVFGRRLPDVARSVGKSIVEFKKGIKDVKDDIETESHLESDRDKSAQLDNNATSKSHDTSA